MSPGPSRPGSASSRAIALPLAGLVVGVAYTIGATRYPVGTLVAPGPGLFPLLAGLTMTIASAVALVTERRAASAVPEPVGPLFRRVPILVAVLAGYAILLKPLGFLVASTALVALVLVVLGRRPLSAAVATAIALSAGAYLTFRLLGVPLPPGLLGLD